MRDLDMGDVMDDARRLEDEYNDRLYRELEELDPAELGRKLYWIGILARKGDWDAIRLLRMIDTIRFDRINTTLCEGCWDRYGCMMCCPWDDGGLADALNREHEEMALGRPLFPNEY